MHLRLNENKLAFLINFFSKNRLVKEIGKVNVNSSMFALVALTLTVSSNSLVIEVNHIVCINILFYFIFCAKNQNPSSKSPN